MKILLQALIFYQNPHLLLDIHHLLSAKLSFYKEPAFQKLGNTETKHEGLELKS